MCRWDLSPAILLLFPADWDCKFPPPWLLHEKNWHMVLAAPSLTRQRPGQAPREPRSRNTDGEKDKRRRSWSAGALWVVSRAAPQQDMGSAAQGALPAEESSPLSFSLFHVFLVEPEEHLESPPSLGYAFKGYWKSTYLGQESTLSSMAMVVGDSEWQSRDREYLRIRDTQTPVWSRRSLLRYQHILPKEGQEIIWETEDHI